MLPSRGVSVRTYRRSLAGLAAFRVAIPLVALALSGHDAPLLPRYDYVPLRGDAEGFYSAMRALLAALADVQPALIALELLALVGSIVVLLRLRHRRELRWIGLLAVVCALSLGATLVVLALPGTTGAAVIGWSLVLAVPLLPFRVLGLGPGPDLAFAVGLTLSLACIAITTAATGVLGTRITGRREIGLGAAALWALWPLLVGPLAGTSAWENGQWDVEVGLALYTEPLSTALVACALALAAARTPSATAACLAGTLLGFATAVKLSNALLLALVVVVLAAAGGSGVRRAGIAALAGAAWLPLVAAYWPKGYVGMFGGRIAAEERPFSLDNVGKSWGESLLFTPRLLVLLVPLLLVGLICSNGRARALLGGTVLVTVAFYSPYGAFAQHPRFLYAALPAACVLIAVALLGVAWIVARRRGPSSTRAVLPPRP